MEIITIGDRPMEIRTMEIRPIEISPMEIDKWR